VNDRPSADQVGLTELIREYDKRWSNLDFVGLSELWVRDNPLPIYVGDEYPAPLIGVDELDRHWARVASRLKAASVSSRLHALDTVSGDHALDTVSGDHALDTVSGDHALETVNDVVRAVLLSRWRLTGRESDVERRGASWITWLLVRRGDEYRIFHHMESQVHLGD
jgi:hypothetical protein